jgi:AraC-like DNA-binding protein
LYDSVTMPAAELIFLFGESVPACTHRIDKRFDGYCTLQYMAGGSVDLSIGARRVAMAGRWFWSAYPGPRVRFGPAEGTTSWPHRYLAFTGPLVWRWERDGLFPVVPRPAPGDADFGPTFDELLALSRQTDRRGQLRAVNSVERLLLELADAPAPDGPRAPWLDAALRRVAAAARGRAPAPDYAALAERVGTSPSTLRRRFVEATGTSPHGYFLQCRAAAARELLGSTDLPVKAVAEQLGYRDVYFFSRQFRQLVGVPPAAYRRTRQG